MNAKAMLAASAALAVVAGTAALAQSPPPAPPQQGVQPSPPPPPPPPPREGRPGEPGGPGGMAGPWRGGPHMHGPMPMGGKGAFLRVDKGGGVTLKCADEDSTKTCLDAAGPLLERLIQAGR